MSNKVTVHIQGYGDVKVKKPKVFTDDTIADMIADTVTKTMNLVKPGSQKKRFHPVLGLGGYIEPDTNAASTESDSGDAQWINPDG